MKMLCNKCNKNEATYYMEQNINGKVTNIALCPECAKEYNSFGFKSFGGFNLLGGLFGVPTAAHERTEKKRCTLCASTFEEIAKNGRVGYTECYKVFSNELEPNIRRIHGNLKHIGRSPGGRIEVSEDEKLEETVDEMTSLRKELNEAVAREDYESAAKLRDRIRELGE